MSSTEDEKNSCYEEPEEPDFIEKEIIEAPSDVPPEHTQRAQARTSEEVPSAEGKEITEIPEIIRLGFNIEVVETEDIKTKGEIIYESGSEKIKKYSVFGFALLCVMLVVLMVMKKL